MSNATTTNDMSDQKASDQPLLVVVEDSNDVNVALSEGQESGHAEDVGRVVVHDRGGAHTFDDLACFLRGVREAQEVLGYPIVLILLFLGPELLAATPNLPC